MAHHKFTSLMYAISALMLMTLEASWVHNLLYFSLIVEQLLKLSKKFLWCVNLHCTGHTTIRWLNMGMIEVNSQHPNIHFTIGKETDHVLPFWMSWLHVSLVHVPSRKKTFMGLLTNYLSFEPLSYKIGLIRTLTDGVFKINNTLLGFHKDITKLVFIFHKNHDLICMCTVACAANFTFPA